MAALHVHGDNVKLNPPKVPPEKKELADAKISAILCKENTSYNTPKQHIPRKQ